MKPLNPIPQFLSYPGLSLTVGVIALALSAGLSGCRVHVDKDANGKEKTVQVDTPFGGVHVNTDKTTASDLGLQLYPGAHQVNDDENHKSADIHMGFGEWQLRIKAVTYATPDSRDKVADFYKKALARYGDVITCENNNPVGSPSATHEGLTCADGGSKNIHIKNDDMDYDRGKLQLKAGSKRHQHIVGFEDSKNGETRFVLVAMDLPAGSDKADGEKE